MVLRLHPQEVLDYGFELFCDRGIPNMRLDTTKAHQRLRLAGQSLAQLEQAPNFQAFEDVWLNFLLHANGVYVQLEQASKISPQARQWFGLKKRQRKDDEMLQYVHQARHADEHSVEKVAAVEPGYMGIGKAAPGYSSSMVFNTLPDGRLHVRSLDGKPVLIEVKPPTIQLRPVTGLGPVVFNPPSSHLGQPLPDRSPATVARHTFQFLSALVVEADSLPA